MNCSQSQKMLDDYIDGTLSTIQLSSLHTHLNSCDNCRHNFIQAQKLQSLLQDSPVPPARPDYEQRMLKFLTKGNRQSFAQNSWLIAGFSSAVAASFALWLVFSPISLFSNNSENMNTVNLLIQKKKTVDLVFNLSNELSEATLTIELPEKIEIAGYSGKRQLSWKTSFKKGANRLALPIIGSEARSGILIARLTNKGTSKTFRVRINTKRVPTSFFNINKLTTTNT